MNLVGAVCDSLSRTEHTIVFCIVAHQGLGDLPAFAAAGRWQQQEVGVGWPGMAGKLF